MKQFDTFETRLLAAADESRDELIELLQSLVRIPSQNLPPGGEELKAQEYIKHWLAGAGIESELIDLKDVAGLTEHELFFKGHGCERREYESRPNLAASVKGSGRGKTLILSGHIDTVPTGRAPWSHGPFSGEAHEGRIFGRGSFDMKGGIAAALMAVRILKRLPVSLEGDVIFETVVDEEHAGANGTLANRLAGYNGDAVIVPEPSSLMLYHAHTGFRIVHLDIVGKSGMVFAGEQLLNPVEAVGQIIECFKAFRKQRRANAPRPPEYAHDSDPVPVFMNKLQAGEFSLNTPMQIPDRCTLEVYWQTMPGETQETVEKEFFAFLEAWIDTHPHLQPFKIEHRFSHRWMPGTRIDRNEHIVKIVEAAANKVLGTPVNVGGAPFPCDLFVFNYFHIPGLIIGPCGTNCHGPDECVEIDSLVTLVKILTLSAVQFCGVA